MPYCVLERRTEGVINDSQRGCHLPVNLGRWSRDLYLALTDRFQRHKFTWEQGEITFHGDPPQCAHNHMVEAVRQQINCFLSRGFALSLFDGGEVVVNFGPHISKAPDMTYALSPGSKTSTVVEVTWANESISKLERQLHIASAAGYNAIAVKRCVDNRSGNAQLADTHFNFQHQDIYGAKTIGTSHQQTTGIPVRTEGMAPRIRRSKSQA